MLINNYAQINSQQQMRVALITEWASTFLVSDQN